MIRLRGGFVGPGPDAVMAAELSILAGAIRAGVNAATLGLRDELRGQIAAAGLGRRLGNAVEGKVYPVKQETLHPAGVVRPRGRGAEDIFESFNLGSTITAKNGRWLAIPTKEAKVGDRRVTPAEFEQRTGIKLRMVAPSRSRNGRYQFLVGESINAKSGRGVRAATRGRVRQGRTVNLTVFFILLPQVHMKKLLSFDSAAETWADRIPDLIEAAMPQGLL